MLKDNLEKNGPAWQTRRLHSSKNMLLIRAKAPRKTARTSFALLDGEA